ncbi:MAG: ABC transporter substrate-binding protein [Desulfamplus sp.]|nr:ABC transporter substrate-binding protein [Desulfamplus sp.]MBF0411820.1 ABC transporter substrate-binding protein [Desulfamplus sp.]
MNKLLRQIALFYSIFYLIASIFITYPALAAASDKISLTSENKPPENKKIYKILAIQHQEFLPYTNAYKGFISALKKSEQWKNINIELYNAKTDLSALDKKIKDISKRNDIDLIFAMGTQSAKKLVNKIKHIPIIFTAVGSPIEAGIIKDWKSSGSNVTGVGTPYQISKSIAQAYSIAKFNSIGITYLAGSPNHEAAVKEIKEFCKKNGVKFVYDSTPFKQKDGNSFPNDVIQKQLERSLNYVLPKVDVFYVQASLTYEKNFTIFRRAFQKYKVPSLGELIFIRKGIVMGVGPNDYIFGEQAAEYAIKILFEGAKPSDLPMDKGKKFTILVNLEAAKIVDFPTSLIIPVLNSADAIYQKIDEW